MFITQMSSLNSMNQSQMDDSMRDLVLQYCEAQANHDDELAQRILAEIEMINKLCNKKTHD